MPRPGELSSGSSAARDAKVNLTGVWTTTDLACEGAKRRETVQIDHVDSTVSATMLSGNDCIPTDYVVFEGKLPRSEIKVSNLPVKFDVDVYDGEPGDPASIEVVSTGTGTVLETGSLELEVDVQTLRFTRASTAGGGSNEPDDSESAGRAGGGGSGGEGGAAAAGRSGSGGAAGRSEAGAGGGGTGGRGGSGGASESVATGGRGGRGGEGGRGGAGGQGGSRAGAGGGGSGGRGGAGGAGGSSDESSGECDEDAFLPGASCDHVAQCGCPARENCRFYEDQPPRCLPAGMTKEGEACDSPSDCDVGLLCVDDVCLRMCRTDDDCEDGTCEQANRDGIEVEGLLYCDTGASAPADKCEPVLPFSCLGSSSPTDDSCFPCGSPDKVCLPDDAASCVTGPFAMPRRPGSACTRDAECFGGGCHEEVCKTWCREDRDCPGLFEFCEFGFSHYAETGDEIGFCIEVEF